MNKQVLVRDMERKIGTFPSMSKVARYMGKSRDYVRELLEGLDYIPDGRSKKYYAGDVADRILQQRRA